MYNVIRFKNKLTFILGEFKTIKLPQSMGCKLQELIYEL